MAFLEFQEPVSEASSHETTKATSLERETKLGHPVRRPALYVALAAPIKQRAGRPPAAGQEPNRLIVTTSSIFNQLSSPVLRSSVCPDKFPVVGEGFPCPCAPAILRGDRRKVLVLLIGRSDMCPVRCRNGVPGSEREGFGRIVGNRETMWNLPRERRHHFRVRRHACGTSALLLRHPSAGTIFAVLTLCRSG